MSVFVLENISKSFIVDKKENKVLRNINIVFPDKGLFSIVGKSGCGKSTLLNILMGIEKPSSGKVLFNGKDISKLKDKKFSEYHLTGVSLVFQHYNLFDELTAFENVKLPLEIGGTFDKDSSDKIKELFSDFHIEDLADRKVKSLSGGEKQRIAILRSVITDPSAILCDEPTGALDSQNSREIMGILKKISKNKLVIMVSHNLNLVNEFSDYIITLKDGELQENKKIKYPQNFSKNVTKKYNYKNKWITKFLNLNLKHNLKKNIFSIIACLLSFTAMFLAVGFSEGSKSSQTNALKQNLGIGTSTAHESQFIEIEGSPLSYEKMIRPSVELVDKYFGSLNSIKYEENISYFISNYPSCYLDDEKITSFEMIPVYDLTLESYGKEMLIDGEPGDGLFEKIIVNEEFAKLYSKDLIGEELTISNQAPVNYITNDSDFPIVKDFLNYTKKFKICGIIREFSFLNMPKIYYSYNGAKAFLKNEIMENVSNFLGKRVSYYDYLEECKNDDQVCSYSSYLFVTDKNEIDKFFDIVSTLENEPLQITSKALETKETYTTFISSFSGTLIIFVLIAFLGINFILGMISLSTFLEDRKNTAILTCLGAKNYSIYLIHILENYFVIFVSSVLASILSIFSQSKLNDFLYQKFGLENLIKIPINNYLNIRFGLFILILLIAIVCSTIFTLVPMSIYRHNSLTDELRDE